MPDGDTQLIEAPSREASNRDLQTLPFDEALNIWTPNLAAALPDHIPLERFKRVVITAVNQTPELARADRRSLFNSCAKCAHDGLYPDGREAALVIYNTKVTRKVTNDRGILVEKEFVVPMVQYLPMIAGIRKRMRNTSEVLSADAQIVCRHDKFYRAFGDDPKIIHEPPPLDQERGEPIGAYAIIKLANGEVLREVMSAHQIDHIMRTFSKGYDRRSSPWQTSKEEMWRKTVLRRCSKAAPTGSELDRLFARDEERDYPNDDSPLREIPPPPQPEDFVSITNARSDDAEEGLGSTGSTFQVFDFVGDPIEFPTAEQARDALLELMGSAKSRKALDAVWESNTTSGLVDDIGTAIRDGTEPLHNAYHGLVQSFEQPNPGSRQDRPATGAQLLDPARDATDTAETGRSEHPEEQGQSLTSTERRSSPPIPHTDPVDPALRDEPKSPSVPVRKPIGKAADWQGTAQDMVLVIKKLTDPDDLTPTGAFVQANRSTLNNMRDGDKAAWITVMYELGQRERALRTGEQ